MNNNPLQSLQSFKAKPFLHETSGKRGGFNCASKCCKEPFGKKVTITVLIQKVF